MGAQTRPHMQEDLRIRHPPDPYRRRFRPRRCRRGHVGGPDCRLLVAKTPSQ